jgi:uncharacterized protein YndB with AHSA1/START domain
METLSTNAITVETTVNAPIEKVWQYWTDPQHVMQWNSASEDWHTPKAENDLRKDGSFSFTMAAKDGSFSFDFGGVYTDVAEHQRIAYTMSDGRKVRVIFESNADATKVIETFDPESENSEEMQRAGWQAIIDNFKKYVENN